MKVLVVAAAAEAVVNYHRLRLRLRRRPRRRPRRRRRRVVNRKVKKSVKIVKSMA